MGSPIARSHLRGLIVPDPRFSFENFRADLSSLTQAGVRPGVPTPQQTSSLLLATTGSFTDGATVELRSLTPGNPGIGGATFAYLPTDALDYRGWIPPLVITGFEFLDYDAAASSRWRHPHIVSLASGSVAIVATRLNQKVVCWRRDSAGAWTSADVYDRGNTYTAGPHPCLVQLPNGRLLCFFHTESSAATYQIRMHYSDDDGATWATGAQACLATAIVAANYEPQRLRAAYLEGQIVVFWHVVDLGTPEDQLRQYASNDLGATLDHVVTMDGRNRGYPDCVVHDGRVVVAYLSSAPAAYTAALVPRIRRIASAYEDVEQVGEPTVGQTETDTMEWATESGGVFASGELALYRDEDGTLYLMGTDLQGAGDVDLLARVSQDGGDTWEEWGEGPSAGFGAATWRSTAATTRPVQYAIACHQGRAIMASRHHADPGTGDGSLSAIYLGGYSTVTMPQEEDVAPSLYTSTGWAQTWLPFDLPEDTTAWTFAGAGTISFGADGMEVVTGNPDSALWLHVPPATVETGIAVLAEVQLVDNQCRIELRTSDATPIEYEVAVLVGETTITLWDLVAGGSIASVATTEAVTGKVQILVELADAATTAWYRPVTAANDAEWVHIGQSTSISSAAANNGNRVRFGQYDDSESRWTMMQVSAGAYKGNGFYGQDNPTELLGRTYMPTPVYVTEGMSVSVQRGPAFTDDAFDVAATYAYGIENVHHEVSSSPRRPWRSTLDAANVTLSWVIDGAPTRVTSPLLGIALIGCNFPTAELHGRSNVGLWSKICDLDFRSGVNLKYDRYGRALYADLSAGASADHYLTQSSLIGSHLSLGGSPTRIVDNASGSWAGGSDTLPVRILLDELLGGEPSTGLDAEIWARDLIAIVPMPTSYTGFRLVIPPATTYEGYFEIGQMVLGPFVGFGRDPAWGRAIEASPIYELTEARNGTRSVRRLNDARRAAEMNWTNGLDTTGITMAGAAPSWVDAWPLGPAFMAPADTAYTVLGLIEGLGGAATPVVYVMTVPQPEDSADVQFLTNRNTFLYGRIRSETLRLDNVLGDEWGSPGEVFRVGTVRIEEEL